MNYVVIANNDNLSKELLHNLGLTNPKEFRVIHFAKKNLKFKIEASTLEELED